MNIILASEVIHPGGAETFILRLAEALKRQGQDARVFVFYNNLLNRELCKILAPDVEIIAAEIPMPGLLGKIDGLLFRLGIDYSIRNRFISRSLNKLIQRQKTQIIHSHLLKVDNLCLSVAYPQQIPVVNTIHGDYLQFFEKTKKGIAIPLLNYMSKATSNLGKLSAVTCISDKQVSFFEKEFPKETNGKTTKIYNGYEGNITEEKSVLKQQLGIAEGDFVFGMVSRGIAEKGWQVAIDAFLQLNNPNTHLVLTGSGDYISALKDKYQSEQRIYFTGHADNPINWINIFDVGLLPSTYPSESLPTVIIEYLYCGLPVIASDAGEIINMTGQQSNPAGIIVPVKDGKVDSTLVSEAMSKYITDKVLYRTHQSNATICYRMFDMNKCVEAYTAVYQQAINQTP